MLPLVLRTLSYLHDNQIFKFHNNHKIFLIFFNDATVGINQKLDLSLVEGEFDSLTSTSICVTLLEVILGVLREDLIVNVTTVDITATGKYYTNVYLYFWLELLVFHIHSNYFFVCIKHQDSVEY